jgi:hypothetical protein
MMVRTPLPAICCIMAAKPGRWSTGSAPLMPSSLVFGNDTWSTLTTIDLPNGRKLITLKDAATYITKLPRTEHAAQWAKMHRGSLLIGPS